MSRYFQLLQRAEGMRPESAPIQEMESSAEHVTSREPLVEMDAAIQEELAKMVHRVFLSTSRARSVVFSGADHGAGCSWITACAADILARRMGGSVCAVDATASRPNVLDYLGVRNGFGSKLNGAQPVTDSLWVSRLRRLSSPLQDSAQDTAARDHLMELRDQFEYVLIDAPPLRSGGDATALAHDADGLVLVLEASVTHRETAKQAVRDVTAANARVLGAVLNKRKFPIPAGIYNKL